MRLTLFRLEPLCFIGLVDLFDLLEFLLLSMYQKIIITSIFFYCFLHPYSNPEFTSALES